MNCHVIRTLLILGQSWKPWDHQVMGINSINKISQGNLAFSSINYIIFIIINYNNLTDAKYIVKRKPHFLPLLFSEQLLGNPQYLFIELLFLLL